MDNREITLPWIDHNDQWIDRLTRENALLEHIASSRLLDQPLESKVFDAFELKDLRRVAYEILAQVVSAPGIFALPHSLGFSLRTPTDSFGDRLSTLTGTAWKGPRIRYNSRVPSNHAGIYHTGGVPRVAESPTSIEDLLFSMVSSCRAGRLPSATEAALEEVLHRRHYLRQETAINQGRIVLAGSVGIAGGVPLYEGLAKRLISNPFGSGRFLTAEELAPRCRVQHLSYGDYPVERWYSALNAIDHLIVLGHDLDEIIDALVSAPLYDDQTGRYQDLEEIVRVVADGKGVDLSDIAGHSSRFHLQAQNSLLRARAQARVLFVDECKKRNIALSEACLQAVEQSDSSLIFQV